MITENRLAKSETSARLDVPKEAAKRRQFWIERGNRILWGQQPLTVKKYEGQYLEPRHDLEWVWANGSYSIQPRKSA